MDASILAHGVGLGEVAQAVQRIAVGTFFAISGAHKLLSPTRHASLRETLAKDRVPFLRFNEWWVPGWEFFGGVAVALGLSTAFSASVLFTICLVACVSEAKGRVEAYKPLDRADALGDYLYLPEVLYGLMLLPAMLGGGGGWSLDGLIGRMG